MSTQHEREPISGGEHTFPNKRLYPIVQLLLDRGHELVWESRPDVKMGFVPQPDGYRCWVYGEITPEDWAAINEKFALPDSIVYFNGIIRDSLNWVDILGTAWPENP